MRKQQIKIVFSIKGNKELSKLSYEELMEYTRRLTIDWHKKKNKLDKPKKNSKNSSIAPSCEIVPPDKETKSKNQSLRKKSEKSNGGQKGHIGTTLKQSNNPDEIITLGYDISNCKSCGYELIDVLLKLKERREVLDLDLKDIRLKITQYQSYAKECPNCGFSNHKNSYPDLVAPHISYGKNIMAIVSYLSVVHYLSYNRIVLALQTMYNITISQGTVDNLLKKASKLSQNEIDNIISQLSLSDKIGIDETGCKVDGAKYWHWAFQNDDCTYVVANKSRGTKVIDENFKDGFVKAIVVHDNYSSYSSLKAKGEQLCLAHKLRDLNYAIECDDSDVMKDMKILIQEAMRDHKQDLLSFQRDILKEQYLIMFDKLLETQAKEKSETQKQINSFKKARDKIFTFLLHPNVPPDNNASERAIRNVKVKLKVSGQFKSFDGAKDYASLRSIIDTARKRNLNEFETLRNIFNGDCVF